MAEQTLQDLTDAIWTYDEPQKYLEGRGLDVNTIVEAQLGYVYPNGSRFSRSIAIPYFDVQGRHRLTRYRRLDPNAPLKYDWLKGSHSHLYGIERVDQPVVYICEGEFDSLILTQCGFPAVGLTGAMHFQRPWRFLFRNSDMVIVVMDTDQSKKDEQGREVGMTGQRAAQKIAAAIGTVTDVDIVELPMGMDVTDLYLKDEAALRRLCEL